MKKILANMLLFAVFLTIPTHTLLANETVWTNPGSPGTPGPRGNTPLVLKKEHVRIDDKHVKAEFWVHNPTDEDIEITMGFPIAFDTSDSMVLTHNGAAREEGDLYSDMSPEQEKAAYEKIARDYYGSLQVSQDGKKLTTRMHVDPKDKSYPLVFLWKAIYPAGKTVHDVVTHPMTMENINNNPNDRLTSIFTYITHTGAFWAKPIGTARFEYCAEPVRELIAHGQAWTSYEKKDPVQCVEHKISIKPTPFEIDKTNGCIVWTRTDWRPKAGVDDITVEFEREHTRECSVFGTFNANPHPIEEAMSFSWCEDNTDTADARDKKETHLAKSLGITEHKLTREKLDHAFLKSTERFNEKFDDAAAFTTYLKQYPRYFEIRDRLRLYQYLRNYYFALRGHEFKDSFLSDCFKNIKPDAEKGASEIAKHNITLLLAEEKRLKKELKTEHQKLLKTNVTF